jgi:hypothetical protein
MKKACGRPGCPELLDSVSLDCYCATHDEFNADLRDEHEDEARCALEKVFDSAREEIKSLKKRPECAFDALAAEHIILHAPEVLRTAEAGETWTAVRHALWLGMWIGNSNGYFDRSENRRLEPDAQWARKQRPTRVAGGKASRKGPPDQDICEAVIARHDKFSRDSWSAVCKYVGEQFGLSRQTVSVRAKLARWR